MRLAPVPGIDNTWASDTGELFSGDLLTLRRLRTCRREKGHGRVSRRVGGRWRPISAPRSIFAAFNGPIPAGMQIDHIDRDPRNDALCNLRLATPAQNSRNRSLLQRSASGQSGVTWHFRAKRWLAHIWVNGGNLHLGSFHTFDEAKAARLEAERIHFGEFAPSASAPGEPTKPAILAGREPGCAQ